MNFWTQSQTPAISYFVLYSFHLVKSCTINPVFLSDIVLHFQDELDDRVKTMCSAFGTQKWICNLGHGIYPDVNPDHMKAFLEAVHKHSKVE